MNREIKFRAYDHIHKLMVYSDKHIGYKPFIDIQSFENYDFGISMTGVYCHAYTSDNFGKILKEADLDIMQYTGLKDKNGVEIYEGDIIKSLINKFKIIYEYGGFLVVNKNQKYSLIKELEMCDKANVKIEVIGNIYENKELLEDESN